MAYKLETSEMARFLWDHTREGMAIVDRDGRIKTANHALSALLGYSAYELEGKHFAELTFSDDVQADIVEFNKLIAGEIDHYEIHKRYITKFGLVVPGKLRVIRFYDQYAVFGQVIPVDDIVTPMMVNKEERTRIFEEMLGEIVSRNWKKLLIFFLVAVGLAAGVVNFDAVLTLLGVGM